MPDLIFWSGKEEPEKDGSGPKRLCSQAQQPLDRPTEERVQQSQQRAPDVLGEHANDAQHPVPPGVGGSWPQHPTNYNVQQQSSTHHYNAPSPNVQCFPAPPVQDSTGNVQHQWQQEQGLTNILTAQQHRPTNHAVSPPHVPLLSTPSADADEKSGQAQQQQQQRQQQPRPVMYQAPVAANPPSPAVIVTHPPHARSGQTQQQQQQIHQPHPRPVIYQASAATHTTPPPSVEATHPPQPSRASPDNSFQESTLHRLCISNSWTAVAQHLREHPHDVTILHPKTGSAFSVLHYALASNITKPDVLLTSVSTVLKTAPHLVNIPDQNGHLPLMAILHPRYSVKPEVKLEVIKALLKAARETQSDGSTEKALLLQRDTNRRTPLHNAVRYGCSSAIVRVILKACAAATRERDLYQLLPLHYHYIRFSRHGQVDQIRNDEIFRMLLQAHYVSLLKYVNNNREECSNLSPTEILWEGISRFPGYEKLDKKVHETFREMQSLLLKSSHSVPFRDGQQNSFGSIISSSSMEQDASSTATGKEGHYPSAGTTAVAPNPAQALAPCEGIAGKNKPIMAVNDHQQQHADSGNDSSSQTVSHNLRQENEEKKGNSSYTLERQKFVCNQPRGKSFSHLTRLVAQKQQPPATVPQQTEATMPSKGKATIGEPRNEQTKKSTIAPDATPGLQCPAPPPPKSPPQPPSLPPPSFPPLPTPPPPLATPPLPPQPDAVNETITQSSISQQDQIMTLPSSQQTPPTPNNPTAAPEDSPATLRNVEREFDLLWKNVTEKIRRLSDQGYEIRSLLLEIPRGSTDEIDELKHCLEELEENEKLFRDYSEEYVQRLKDEEDAQKKYEEEMQTREERFQSELAGLDKSHDNNVSKIMEEHNKKIEGVKKETAKESEMLQSGYMEQVEEFLPIENETKSLRDMINKNILEADLASQKATDQLLSEHNKLVEEESTWYRREMNRLRNELDQVRASISNSFEKTTPKRKRDDDDDDDDDDETLEDDPAFEIIELLRDDIRYLEGVMDQLQSRELASKMVEVDEYVDVVHVEERDESWAVSDDNVDDSSEEFEIYERTPTKDDSKRICEIFDSDSMNVEEEEYMSDFSV